MRAALEFFVLSLMTLAASFVTRHMFLWDVQPVSWDHPPPQTGALEAAYLLLSIENIATVVAAISLGCVAALLVRRLRLPSAAAEAHAAAPIFDFVNYLADDGACPLPASPRPRTRA